MNLTLRHILAVAALAAIASTPSMAQSQQPGSGAGVVLPSVPLPPHLRPASAVRGPTALCPLTGICGGGTPIIPITPPTALSCQYGYTFIATPAPGRCVPGAPFSGNVMCWSTSASAWGCDALMTDRMGLAYNVTTAQAFAAAGAALAACGDASQSGSYGTRSGTFGQYAWTCEATWTDLPTTPSSYNWRGISVALTPT